MKSCGGDVEKADAKNRIVTEDWLERHNVPYDILVFGKPFADAYIDDKAITLDEWQQYGASCMGGGYSGKKVARVGRIVVKDDGGAQPRGRVLAEQLVQRPVRDALRLHRPSVCVNLHGHDEPPRPVRQPRPLPRRRGTRLSHTAGGGGLIASATPSPLASMARMAVSTSSIQTRARTTPSSTTSRRATRSECRSILRRRVTRGIGSQSTGTPTTGGLAFCSGRYDGR